jgi:hypothetical protein
MVRPPVSLFNHVIRTHEPRNTLSAYPTAACAAPHRLTERIATRQQHTSPTVSQTPGGAPLATQLVDLGAPTRAQADRYLA